MRTSARGDGNAGRTRRTNEVKRPENFNGHVDSHAEAISRLRSLLDGNLPGSGRLPPERILAGEIGVSRRAVRQALDLLEAEGRISRQQGRGTFVCVYSFVSD